MTADTASSKSKEAAFFKKFDIIVATNCAKKELVRINSICRAEKVLFYAGDVFGFFGFSFMDLISHEYVEDVTQHVEQESEGADGEPASKKQKTTETETKSVKKAMTFVSLAETLEVDWSSELYAKRIRRMDPSFFLLQVLFNFQSETGHTPRPNERETDLTMLKEMRDQTLENLSVPTTKITDEMLSKLIYDPVVNYLIFPADLLFAELSPVCAIVGGVLAQEVIKAISNKDAPHNNYFFYNPLESCGVVETIGY